MTRALAALLLAIGGCKKAAPPPPPPVPAEAAPEPDDVVRPVYGAGAASPLAQKLCKALHDLPAERRASCCRARPGIAFTSECVRVLSAALAGDGIELSSAAVDSCAAARERSFAGCGWVGPSAVPLPRECAGLIRGKRKQGEVCRSSLECAEGQRCLGVGPTDAGRCGPPRSDGQACLTAVDPLAVYTMEDLDAHHPECSGFCGHRKCMPRVAAGAKCTLARECPSGTHCDGEACAAGAFAPAGGKCLSDDACDPGNRCVLGRCVVPRFEGAGCTNDAECAGACLSQSHACGMRCDGR